MTVWSFDTETWLIQPGLLAPPLVCGSVATREPGSERLLDKEQARGFFRAAIAEGDTHLVGANLAYDLGVMAADAPRLVAPIFAALDAGRLHCVQVREALIDIARGMYVGRGPVRQHAGAGLPGLHGSGGRGPPEVSVLGWKQACRTAR